MRIPSEFPKKIGACLATLLLASTLAACGADKKNSESPSSSSSSSSSGNPIALGKTEYEAQCTTCHGILGNGATKINIANGLPGGATNLATFIAANMPKGNPANCVGACAENIAAYIKSWESATPVVERSDYTVELVNNCGGPAVENPKETAIFDNSINNVMGWTWVDKNPPYDKLARTYTDPLYTVPGITAPDASCNLHKTQETILLKKYADWNHQHSNGIETSIVAQNKTFSDVDKIVFELKLNSAKTKIFSKADLMAIYKETITTEQYDYLDQGKAVFAISILGPNQTDATLKVQTQRFIEIDQGLYADKWLRITIPFNQMDVFTDEVWVKTATTFAAQASTLADRLQIDPEILGSRRQKADELTYGNVIRNMIGGPKDPEYAAKNIPETFKEMGITIKKISVVWK